MKKVKTPPPAPRWSSTPAEEAAAARRIQATKRRNTPEGRAQAKAAGQRHRMQPGVKDHQRDKHRAWRLKVAITFPAGGGLADLGEVPRIGPKRCPEDREGILGQPLLDF